MGGLISENEYEMSYHITPSPCNIAKTVWKKNSSGKFDIAFLCFSRPIFNTAKRGENSRRH